MEACFGTSFPHHKHDSSHVAVMILAIILPFIAKHDDSLFASVGLAVGTCEGTGSVGDNEIDGANDGMGDGAGVG